VTLVNCIPDAGVPEALISQIKQFLIVIFSKGVRR